MTRRCWSLKAWTSAHVYLGLSLVVIATLHTGFQFGWNVHTLAYALMMLVILSGIYGISTYAFLPKQLSDNRAEMTARADDRRGRQASTSQLQVAAQPLVRRRHRDRARLARRGSVRRRPLPAADRDRARRRQCAGAAPHPRAGWRKPPARRQQALEQVAALLQRKAAALSRMRRHVRIRAMLEVWLYVHVPLTFALIAAWPPTSSASSSTGRRGDGFPPPPYQPQRRGAGDRPHAADRGDASGSAAIRAATSASTTSPSRSAMRRWSGSSAARIDISAETGLAVELDGRKPPAPARSNIAAGGDILIGSRSCCASCRRRRAPTRSSIDVERDRRRCRGREGRRAPLRTGLGDARQAADGLGCSSSSCSASSSPGRSGPTTRAGASRRATHGRSTPTRCGSSGSLSRGHAALGDNCQACHVKPFVAVRDDACKSCHTGIHDHADLVRLARARPDLGTLGPDRARRQGNFFDLPAGPLRRLPYRA